MATAKVLRDSRGPIPLRKANVPRMGFGGPIGRNRTRKTGHGPTGPSEKALKRQIAAELRLGGARTFQL